MNYGVRFRDGSVRHPWNGRTQLQRATEELARLRKEYPGDAEAIVLVSRPGPDGPWVEVE